MRIGGEQPSGFGARAACGFRCARIGAKNDGLTALSESRLLRLFVFGALYFAQGVPWGFIGVGYVVMLTDLGLDNAAIGKAVGLAYVPWSFKLIWGPLVDRFSSFRFGRRRPFIVAAQFSMGASLLALLAFDPREQLAAVSVTLFVHNTFAAMQDVAVDGMAVDLLPEGERGRANSIMWASKGVGTAVGGGAGTLVAKHFGWPALLSAITLLIWAIMAIMILVRERPPGAPNAQATEVRFSARELWRSFAFRTALAGIAIAALAPAGYGLIGTVFLRMVRADLGLSEEVIATLTGVVDPVTSVLGALLGGLLADRIGVRRTMALFMALIGASLGVFAASRALWPDLMFLMSWGGFYNGVQHAFSAAALAFFMSLSNPAVGATQFAVFMAMTNLTYAWATPVGGWIADQYGASTTFAVGAIVQVVAIGLLPLCNPRRARARFAAAEPVAP